jgi:hypothetical protein
MTPPPHRAGWIAPLLVGAAAAIAAEVAIGVLLYAGPGLMRSLTTVLAVEGAALAAGLWRGPALPANEVDRLRRRWLFCLATFLAAAVFGTSWSVIQDIGGGPLGQGLGLAVLGALPLYSCGLVLAGMEAVTAGERAGRSWGTGAPAALGAAAGFVMTGVLLPRAPIPASLLVASLVMLSAAGMIFGIVLGARPVVHLRAARASAVGEVRIEDRVPGGGGDAARYLLEAGHVRRRVSLDGHQVDPWDVAVARAVVQAQGRPVRVLSLGGGASPLARALLGLHPEAVVDVLERNEAVVDLARDHLDTALGEPPPEGVRVGVGNLEDLLADVRGPYDLVLVDTSALAPLGGLIGLSRRARAALFAATGGRGALAWGPRATEPGRRELPEGWSATLLRRVSSDAQGRRGEDHDDVLVLLPLDDTAPWIGLVEGFAPSNGGPPEP